MVTFRERHDLIQVETLGLRARDPETSLEVQRNIDELWRQVAGLRQLTGINEDAINAVLDASRDPDVPAGDQPTPGGTPEDPGTSTPPATQWKKQTVNFASEDGTGFSSGGRVSTLEFNPVYTFRILSMTVTIEYQTPGSDSPGTGGIFLNIGGGTGKDVLVGTYNASTLTWTDGQTRTLSGDAIEAGGASREFSPGQKIRFDHQPKSSPSGARIKATALIEFKVPVSGS